MLTLPNDTQAVILSFIKEAKILHYFRICKLTYHLREWLLLRYNFLTTNLYIPPFKNPYPYLLMHYYENKLLRKGRDGYKHYIMTFLCNQKRNTTTMPLKSDYYDIIDFCESHDLICNYDRHLIGNSTLTIYKINKFDI